MEAPHMLCGHTADAVTEQCEPYCTECGCDEIDLRLCVPQEVEDER